LIPTTAFPWTCKNFSGGHAEFKSVITGRCRSNTFQILSDAGIYVYLKQSGTVKEVLEKYTQGRLRRTTGPSAHSGP